MCTKSMAMVYDIVWSLYNIFFLFLLVLSLTSVSSTKLVTKQQFWENTTCPQRFCFVDIMYFKKKRICLKNKIYSKNKPSKRLDYLWKACCQASVVACLTLSPPLFTRPVWMIHRVTRSLDFWLEHHCIYFLTIVLSTIVAVGMKFDSTCRQRNLSSTTALVSPNFLWTIFLFHQKNMFTYY